MQHGHHILGSTQYWLAPVLYHTFAYRGSNNMETVCSSDSDTILTPHSIPPCTYLNGVHPDTTFHTTVHVLERSVNCSTLLKTLLFYVYRDFWQPHACAVSEEH
jgi:hypothetical protein